MRILYSAFFIQKIKQAHLGLDEVDARLVVVEIDERPWDLLLHVLLLLQLEHVLEGKCFA